jgi:glycosyltransferase involved in cell wall biosynthesis
MNRSWLGATPGDANRSSEMVLVDRLLPGGVTVAEASVIHINGRFLTQPLTGVQRFGIETLAAMERLWPKHQPPPIVLSPRSRNISSFTTANASVSFSLRSKGPLRGHAWEQTLLPWATRNGLLVNLGNMAPLTVRNQIVVIHDASVYSVAESYSRPFRLVYPLMYQAIARSGARIVTVSDFSRRELSRHLSVPATSIDVVHEGAEHIHAFPAMPDVLTRNQLQPGRFVLVVGSLARHKNLGVLCAVAKMLEERGVPLVVTGGLDKKVFGKSATFSSPQALYIGRVTDPELRALYEAASVLVFPSLYEGFGLPAIEAMLCGCPVVAANSSSLPEICGDAALYCDPTSPAAFTQAVEALLNNPALRDSLRTSGLARAQTFTWDNTARALIDIINRELART